MKPTLLRDYNQAKIGDIFYTRDLNSSLVSAKVNSIKQRYLSVTHPNSSQDISKELINYALLLRINEGKLIKILVGRNILHTITP